MTKIPAKFSRCDRYCALGIGVLEAAILTGPGANGDGGGEQGISVSRLTRYRQDHNRNR
jgi:hypothetical protein